MMRAQTLHGCQVLQQGLQLGDVNLLAEFHMFSTSLLAALFFWHQLTHRQSPLEDP